jgi:hypothetical protein
VSILDGTLERGPFAAEGGRTDATFERAVLRDGTRVVIKHVDRDGLLAKLTGGFDRLYELWTSGVFARIPEVIDHTTLAVERDGDGYIVVMRNASAEFLGDERVLSREESCRVLQAVDAMHREFWGEAVPGACSSDLRLRAFTDLGRGDWSLGPVWRRGWELFAEVAPRDVSDVTLSLLADPAPLLEAMRPCEQTFIHGDLRLHNLGLTDDRVVLLDWEIAGTGPPAVEFGWYLIISASRIDATREEITQDFVRIAGDRFDPYALELGMISALLSLGWNKAIDIVDNPDEAVRLQERADLDWWVLRVREALEAWSPV